MALSMTRLANATYYYSPNERTRIRVKARSFDKHSLVIYHLSRLIVEKLIGALLEVSARKTALLDTRLELPQPFFAVEQVEHN